MTANIDGLLEQGKRALREGNKVEAQTFLIKVTELDERNEEAWLWLASAVDTEEEKRICLNNVLLINANNSEATRMLAELDRGSAIGATSFDSNDSTNPFGDDFDIGGGNDNPFVVNDDPFGAPASSPPAADPFGGAFTSDFGVQTVPPTTTTGGDAGGPFSSQTFSAPPPPPPPANPPSMQSNLFDEPIEPPSAPAPTQTPTVPDDTFGKFDTRPETGYLFGEEGDADGDDFGEEEDDAPDYLAYLTSDIKPTRLPGTNEPLDRNLVIGIGIVAGLNVLALIGLVVQLVM
jgi:hypothetical protein